MPDDQPLITHNFELDEGQGQEVVPYLSFKELAERLRVGEKRVRRAVERTQTATRMERRQSGNRTVPVQVVSLSSVPLLLEEIKRTEIKEAPDPVVNEGLREDGQEARPQGQSQGQRRVVQGSVFKAIQNLSETVSAIHARVNEPIPIQGQGQIDELRGRLEDVKAYLSKMEADRDYERQEKEKAQERADQERRAREAAEAEAERLRNAPLLERLFGWKK